MSDEIRIVIIDDETLVRAGLRLLLDGVAGIRVVGEADDGSAASRLVAEQRPDLVLMDVRMPGCDGITATAALTKGPGAPPVLILTAFDTDEFVVDALRAGAVGFVLKDTPPPQLIEAVRRAATGSPEFSPAVLHRLVSLATRRPPRSDAALAALTPREREIADAVARGASNAEIAEEFYLSLATVKSHVANLFTKLGVSNRVQLAIAVLEAR